MYYTRFGYWARRDSGRDRWKCAGYRDPSSVRKRYYSNGHAHDDHSGIADGEELQRNGVLGTVAVGAVVPSKNRKSPLSGQEKICL